MVPVRLFDVKESGQRTFANEREILYQVLFDMKKDIMDLKQIVATILSASGDKMKSAFAADRASGNPPLVSQDPASLNFPFKYDNIVPEASSIENDPKHEEEIQEATEYEERALSLEDVEKDMIVKALERHNGKRKPAANDLKISERTLYRKIKEYKLENL
jgi:DNA-binding NtrC family response regulator